MLPHVVKQLKARGLNYSEIFLLAVAKECSSLDTAVVLGQLETPIPYVDDKSSNGDLVLLIVRNNFPVTIMLRRSWNQPLTKEALDVREIRFWNGENDD